MFAVRMRLGRFRSGPAWTCIEDLRVRTSSVAALSIGTCSRKCNSAMRDIEKRRRVVADDSHHRGRGHLNQRSARPRSPQQQVKHVHLLMVRRPVVQQAEQQRQLKFVLPSNRGRSGAVPTHRQRVCGVHPSCHTRWAPEASIGIANTLCWKEEERAAQLA
jgi:hypothetical protein